MKRRLVFTGAIALAFILGFQVKTHWFTPQAYEVDSAENYSDDPAPWPTPTSTLNRNTSEKNVLTFVCETDDNYKPNLIFQYCGDGGAGLESIKWNSWGIDGAFGTGRYFQNDCDPDCADGTLHYTSVKITLTVPVQIGPKVFLTMISYQEVDSKGNEIPIEKGGKSGGWDLGADYRDMKSVFP